MSGGGGGAIIIRYTVKKAMEDPLVSGVLPPKMRAIIDPILAKDINNWSVADHQEAVRIFHWIATRC